MQTQALLTVYPRRRSLWVSSCLPRSDAALRRARRFVAALDDTVGLGNFDSITDAAVSTLAPELREPMRKFYDSNGPMLSDYVDDQTIDRLDGRIATFIEAVSLLTVEQIRDVIEVMRKGQIS